MPTKMFFSFPLSYERCPLTKVVLTQVFVAVPHRRTLTPILDHGVGSSFSRGFLSGFQKKVLRGFEGENALFSLVRILSRKKWRGC